MSYKYVIKAIGLWGGDVWHPLLEESGTCDPDQASRNYFLYKCLDTGRYEVEISHLDVIVDKIRHETNWKTHLGKVLKECNSIEEYKTLVANFEGFDLPPWYKNLTEWINKLGTLHLDYLSTKFIVNVEHIVTKDGQCSQSQG